MLSDEEARKKHSKRLKKELKRKAEDEELHIETEVTIRDLFRRLSESFGDHHSFFFMFEFQL